MSNDQGGKVATYHHVYRAEPKEPTQFGSVSGSEIQNVPFSHSGIVFLYFSELKEPTLFGSVSGSEIQNLPSSHSGIVSLYRSEPKEPTSFGSVSGSEIQNICIGRKLALSGMSHCGHSREEGVRQCKERENS